MKNLIIMGANSPEIIRVIDSINQVAPAETQIHILGFIDNDPQKHETLFIERYPVLGSPAVLSEKRYYDSYVINNITRDCHTRKLTTEQISRYTCNFMALVHQSVERSYTQIGQGVLVLEKCVISPRVHIGAHCTMMIGATVAHDCSVGEFSFIGPAVHICGNVTIGREVFIGAGAIILPKLRIGDYARIGAGAVVMHDVEERTFVLGNPARKMPACE